MQKKNKKYVKQLFAKRFSTLLLVCYMLNLLQFQISPALHVISHIFEAPDHIISHHSIDDGKDEVHDYGNHADMQVAHEHEIIDLLDSILESSNEDNNPDETTLSELKFDKHINVEKYHKKIMIEAKNSNSFSQRPLKSKRGHLAIIKEPPRLS